MKSIRLSRRTMLRGAGVAIQLPLLEAMLGSKVAAAPRSVRMGIFFVPNGCNLREWIASQGATGPVPPAFFGTQLKSIAPDLLWVNNLDNARGGGGHESIGAGFLTCQRVIETETGGKVGGPGKSMDQVIADKMGASYTLGSLVVTAQGSIRGCCPGLNAGLNNLSWRTQPAPKIQDPQNVFSKIAPQTPGAAGATEAARRTALRKSVLDHGTKQARRLQDTVGQADRERLQGYLDSLRDVEKGLAATTGVGVAPTMGCAAPSALPTGTLTFDQHNQLMYDAIFLAYQCNLTPVSTFMMDFEFSDRKPPITGLTQGHHGASHDNPGQHRLIHAWYAERFAVFVKKMSTARDVDGRTLLENSILTFSPGVGEGKSHAPRDIPILIAGQAGGRLKSATVYSGKRPLADLWRTLMPLVGATGADVDSFGDGTGPIREILA